MNSNMQPGMMQPGMMQPNMMQPGMMQPGMMQPGMMQPGMMQPGMMQPGMMQPGMMQPGMMQPGMMQPGMGMMPMVQQPMFKQISIGQGIDMAEFQKIVAACTTAYSSKQTPLSTVAANAVKNLMGGDWCVVVFPVGKTYDFSLTKVKGGDFMSFSLDSLLFQVCRIN